MRDDAALAHHHDAIAQMHELRRVGARQHDGLALRGEAAEHHIDLPLGLDVDAARRIVEEQDRRIARHPFGERHFLLVAARQRLDLPGEVALDAEPVGQVVSASSRSLARSRSVKAARAPEARQHQVPGDAVDEVQAFALAVGRHIGEAEALARGTDDGRPRQAVEARAPRRGRQGAIEAEQQVLLPLADETADAENLAAANLQIDVAQETAGEAR